MPNSGRVRPTASIAAAAGEVVLSYDAYGQAVGFTQAAAKTSLLYAGEHTDADGRQYLRARWYAPSTGRFGRMDPYEGSLHSPGSLHAYGYCMADPVNYIDPSGCAGLGIVVQLVRDASWTTNVYFASVSFREVMRAAAETVEATGIETKLGPFAEAFVHGFLLAMDMASAPASVRPHDYDLLMDVP